MKTVADLIAALSKLDPNLPVLALWDSMEWPVHRVEQVGRNAIIDVSKSDWSSYIAEQTRRSA